MHRDGWTDVGFGLVLLVAAALTGCGSSDSEPSGAAGAGGGAGANAGGGAGAGGGAALFPNVPNCHDLDNFIIQGKLDGADYFEKQAGASNLTGASVEAGIGETFPGSFFWTLRAFVAASWVKGEKQPMTIAGVTYGTLYLKSEHPLKERYLCIKGGEIGVVTQAQTPKDHVLLQWHITELSQGTAAADAMPRTNPGNDCDGPVVSADLYGCLDRDTPYFP